MSEGRRLRPAVRALVMDRDRRVLLVHFDFGNLALPTGLWACPGGGFDPGETNAEALRRELRGEGLDDMLWWTWADLQDPQRRQDSADRTYPDFATMSPRSLFHMLEDLMANGGPREPLRLDPL